jgi:membrane-bound serine protease (ClpP class)
MIALGIALLATGVALLVAEAHAPGGVLGALGAVAAVAGTIIAVSAADGGVVLALVLALIVAVAAGVWLWTAARAVKRTRQRRVRSGREALVGVCGEARSPLSADPGRVFVDGALWRARAANPDEEIEPGETVVVERVDGLTLTVRRAESWELTP